MPSFAKNCVDPLARVADTAEAEVPEERLGRDEGDGRYVGEAGLVDLVLDVEEELVGGAEAGAALGGADDDGSRVGEEALPCLAGEQRRARGCIPTA